MTFLEICFLQIHYVLFQWYFLSVKKMLLSLAEETIQDSYSKLCCSPALLSILIIYLVGSCRPCRGIFLWHKETSLVQETVEQIHGIQPTEINWTTFWVGFSATWRKCPAPLAELNGMLFIWWCYLSPPVKTYIAHFCTLSFLETFICFNSNSEDILTSRWLVCQNAMGIFVQ